MAGQKLITNTATVKTEAENLASNAVRLNSCRESIEVALNESREAWEQSQQDAQTYTKGLDENISYLQNMIDCNKDFSTAVTNYMNVTEQTGSKTV